MSIVDPSVLELLNHAESRYTLVVEASKREDKDNASVILYAGPRNR